MLKTNSGWEIKLDATGLPRLDGGQFYQAWLRNADGVLVPIGTFNEGTDVTLWAGVPPDQFPTMTITRESADGNQDSSGQRVLVGTAVEEAHLSKRDELSFRVTATSPERGVACRSDKSTPLVLGVASP